MGNVMTPEFRVSYPNVFKPKLNEMNGKQEYSIVALFPKNADLTKLKEAALAAIVEKWGADKALWPKNLRMPFRKQEERMKTDEKTGKQFLPPGHEEGCVFMNLKSSQRPGVVDQQVQPIIDESQFYAGCWAQATINAYCYDTAGNRGINFGLNNIQKVKEGDPLSGRPTPQNDFSPLEKTAGTSATELFD